MESSGRGPRHTPRSGQAATKLYGGHCLTQRRKDARAQRAASTRSVSPLGALAPSREEPLNAEPRRRRDAGGNRAARTESPLPPVGEGQGEGGMSSCPCGTPAITVHHHRGLFGFSRQAAKHAKEKPGVNHVHRRSVPLAPLRLRERNPWRRKRRDTASAGVIATRSALPTDLCQPWVRPGVFHERGSPVATRSRFMAARSPRPPR